MSEPVMRNDGRRRSSRKRARPVAATGLRRRRLAPWDRCKFIVALVVISVAKNGGTALAAA